MGFKIAHGTPTTHIGWYDIDRTTATNLFLGQLVKKDSASFNGLAPLAIASGAGDTSADEVIFGLVIGTNNYPNTTLYDATYGRYIASAQSQAAQLAIQKMGVEGMHPKGDPAPKVQVAKINASTVLEAPIYNATYGTAITLLTATVGSTTGAGMTTNACDVATVANMATTYCRSGANAGIYRVNKTAHATVHTYDTYWPYAIAIGDTFVIAGLVQGTAFAQINATAGYIGMCFDNAAALTSNYFKIEVLELNLAEAGKERVIFQFNGAHFTGK